MPAEAPLTAMRTKQASGFASPRSGATLTRWSSPASAAGRGPFRVSVGSASVSVRRMWLQAFVTRCTSSAPPAANSSAEPFTTPTDHRAPSYPEATSHLSSSVSSRVHSIMRATAPRNVFAALLFAALISDQSLRGSSAPSRIVVLFGTNDRSW